MIWRCLKDDAFAADFVFSTCSGLDSGSRVTALKEFKRNGTGEVKRLFFSPTSSM